MTEKRKALGRGLESLLPPRPFPITPTLSPTPGEKDEASGHHAHPLPNRGGEGWGTLPPGESVQEIPLDHLDANPYQTRSQLDEKALDELCQSIMQLGVIEPIIVRPKGEGRYQVVAGERRVKAAYMADKVRIPAVVRQMSDQQAMEMTIVENLQREDLSILDQARAYLRLSQEFGLTQDDIATRTGKERSTVANYLRLLKLPDELQKLIEKGDLTFGHAKVLMALSTGALMVDVARKVVNNSLSVRQTETLVTNLVQARPTAKKERIVDANVREAEETLHRLLGVRVAIDDRNGKGKIVLRYGSLEDFDRIMQAIAGE